MTHVALAKITGALFLLQMFGGIFLNFFFLGQLKTDIAAIDPSLLSRVTGLATLLALALASVNLIAAAIGHHLFARQAPIHCALLLAFSTIALTLTAVEYAQLAELTSLLIHLSNSGVQSLNESLALSKQLLASGRNEIHYMAICCSSFSLLLFYILLYRSTSIPRLLTGFAIAACLLQLIALGSTFFQAGVINSIQLPLFITQFVLPLYLITKGFRLTAATQSKRLTAN